MSSISSFKPFPIDKLESDYSNWIVYSTQMLNCVRASGLTKHLDGRAVEPDELKYDSKTRKWLDAAGNAANDAVAGDFEKRLDEWQMVQAHIKSQIFFSIPESLLISVRNLPTANDIWEAIVKEVETRSDLYVMDIRQQIMTKKPESEAKVPEHLDLMKKLRERLTGMGSLMSDAEFNAAISSAVPAHYRPIIAALTTTHRALGTQLKSDDLIRTLKDEFESGKLNGTIPKESSKNSDNAALYTNQKNTNRNSRGNNSNRGRGGSCNRGGGNRGGKQKSQQQFFEGECHNCHNFGHRKSDCRAKGGGMYQTNQNQQELANSAESSNGKSANHTFLTAENALMSSEKTPPSQRPRCVDMGAISHFSPDRASFTTFALISPEPIQAADGRIFYATGTLLPGV